MSFVVASVFLLFILFLFYCFFLMIRRPPRSTQSRSSAASDVYKRQGYTFAQIDQALTVIDQPPANSALVNLADFAQALESARGQLIAMQAQIDQQADELNACLLYTSDAADDPLCVDLGGRRIIKKKKNTSVRLPFRI